MAFKLLENGSFKLLEDSSKKLLEGGSPTVPGVPTVVGGTAGNTQVTVTWTAPAANGGSALTDYSVTVYDGGGGAPTGVTGATTRTVGSPTPTLAFTGLTNGTAYTFRVAAVNGVGTGPQSALSGPRTPTGATVASDAPANGTTAGGTTVIIAGSGFTGATSVKFGSVPAASFTVDSDVQITAVAPAHAAGTVQIVVS